MKRLRIALPWMAAISLSLLAAIGFAGCKAEICRDQIITCPKNYKRIYVGPVGPCCENSMAGCCQYQLCGRIYCRKGDHVFYAGFERRKGRLRDKGRWCQDNTAIPGDCKKW